MGEMEEQIVMAHGSGGVATEELIEKIFAKAFDNPVLKEMEDSAVVEGYKKIAVTTDSFVVTPLEFRGGDIGRLSVCGTVNDLLMRGAIPKYLTCGYILEEGLSLKTLERVVTSMAKTAREAGVTIVAGDTKVIEGNGGLLINTAGVGEIPEGMDIKAAGAKPGDAILVSGTMGDHHGAILSHRMSIDSSIESDVAPLNQMVSNLLAGGVDVHTLRDVTRGGLGTVLKELADASACVFDIYEEKIPIQGNVEQFAGLLGLDPLYMGNEGKMVAILPEDQAEEALKIIRSSRYGENACLLGTVRENPDHENSKNEKKGRLLLHTEIGGVREMDILQGEGLPRIC